MKPIKSSENKVNIILGVVLTGVIIYLIIFSITEFKFDKDLKNPWDVVILVGLIMIIMGLVMIIGLIWEDVRRYKYQGDKKRMLDELIEKE